jgi:hypothetical protein
VAGGYVSARRNVSPELTAKVTRKLAAECGIDAGAVTHELRVPFQWHDHWHKNDRHEATPVTLAEIEGDGRMLASDPREGEYFTRLVERVVSTLSLEDQGDVPMELLPMYSHEYVFGLPWLPVAIGYDKVCPAYGFRLTSYRVDGGNCWYPDCGVALLRHGVEIGKYASVGDLQEVAAEIVRREEVQA